MVAALAAVALFGGIFAVTQVAGPTPIFDTGGPANDGAARTSIWSGAYNWVYESWLPSDPAVDHSISTVKAWMYRQGNYNGVGTFTVSVGGGGIDESKCPNQPNGDFIGCAVQYPATYIPADSPTQVTFDVSGQGWVRRASTTPTQLSIDSAGGDGIMQLWAASASQGSGHCAKHAGTCYVLHTGSGGPSGSNYYDLAVAIYETLAAPTPGLTADFTSSSDALTATFASTVAGGNPPYTYQWDFGDQTHSTVADPSHTYALAGTYGVKLSVGDSGFHLATVSHAITVSSQSYTPMSVDFAFTVDADGLTAHFTSSVSKGLQPYTYSWAFGDNGPTSSSANPVHTYAATGTYTVALSVTDTKPATVSATHTVQTNKPQPPPTASFSFTATDLNVAFVGSASGGSPPYTYAWAFGDGASSTMGSIAHAYPTDGSYSAKFTVTDSNGQTGSETRTVTVHSPPPTPQPLSKVDFTTENVGNRTVSLTSSVTGGNGTLAYSWDFGDAQTSSQGSPSHQYAVPGTYTVNLTVSDASGARLSATHAITVTVAAGPPLPWAQIIGIVLAGVGATMAALMLEYRKLRKVQYVLGVVVLVAVGIVLLAGVI